jgi:hypothetical protein
LDESVARTEIKIDTDDSEATGDQSRVKAKRKNLLHPFKILLAIITYKAGKFLFCYNLLCTLLLDITQAV